MADNMMRLAGREPSTGTAKALTVALDTNGDGVLRIVDAAPFAYDPSLDARKIAVIGADYGTKIISISTPGTVNASGNETITIVPPAGREWILRNLSFLYPAPIGASSGNHTVFVRYGLPLASTTLLYVTTGSNTPVSLPFSYGDIQTTLSPNNVTLVRDNLTGLRISNACPLFLRYENATNANNTLARGYNLVVTEIGVIT